MTIPHTKAIMTSKFFFLITVFTLAASAAGGAEGLTPACSGSLHVGSFRLLIEPAAGGAPLALHDVNMIQPGQKLRYEPVHLAPAIKDKAKIALLLVPASAHLSDEAPARGEGKGGNQDIDVLEA